ncbi:hypothetical protein GCM10023258_35360 [Terrabacter aeriphilus]|uniref:Uncharacterized protein n=1 Tax=Terrabacter aeriphilus TaxID=515662 RepID=A0ABP9JLQ2_9MICO
MSVVAADTHRVTGSGGGGSAIVVGATVLVGVRVAVDVVPAPPPAVHPVTASTALRIAASDPARAGTGERRGRGAMAQI